MLLDVVGFDWNCPAYITPRSTESEIREATAPLHARIAALEVEVARLQAPSTAGPADQSRPPAKSSGT